MKTPTQKP